MKFMTAAWVALALGAAPAMAAPRTYDLDPAHTQVLFSVGRFGFNSVYGIFANAQGEVVLDEADPGQSRVTASVRVADLWTADATRDEHVRGPRWLNGAEAPELRFVSTSVRVIDARTADVTGDLTIGRVTRPETFRVVLNRLGRNPASPRHTAGFTLEGRIKRSDYGITTAQQLIGDEVAIHIEALALERAE
ncbi:YceI family protein [Brevundimonas sp. 2R-24]|uniref:YceI family protein n=1 Tax=Peiella sedimenti TaxID=3061083 RepID=A0ABT8SLN7_9CAUL|nr:YceI family protein [Caulobacteraceae bacterium XZ-24]